MRRGVLARPILAGHQRTPQTDVRTAPLAMAVAMAVADALDDAAGGEGGGAGEGGDRIVGGDGGGERLHPRRSGDGGGCSSIGGDGGGNDDGEGGGGGEVPLAARAMAVASAMAVALPPLDDASAMAVAMADASPYTDLTVTKILNKSVPNCLNKLRNQTQTNQTKQDSIWDEIPTSNSIRVAGKVNRQKRHQIPVLRAHLPAPAPGRWLRPRPRRPWMMPRRCSWHSRLAACGLAGGTQKKSFGKGVKNVNVRVLSQDPSA